MVFGNGNSNGNGNDAVKDPQEMTVYMGRNMEFKGTLTFEGSGRIDGKVEGKITAKGVLMIGEEARISSEIDGDTVIIGGKVNGKIIGREKVQLLSTAIVNADITAPCLTIEEGSQFNGNCKMAPGKDRVSTSQEKEDRTPVMAG